MNRDFGIIDVSAARATEGLRVLEDVARFSLLERELCVAIRFLRHGIKGWNKNYGSSHVVSSRFLNDALDNFGADSSAGSTLYELIRANSGRTTEAFRVMEEMIKLIHPQKSFEIQKARYQMYSIERDLLVKTNHFWLRHFFESGFVFPASDHMEQLKDCIDSGAKMIRLQKKNASSRLFFEKAKELCRYIARHEKLGKEKVFFLLESDSFDEVIKLPVHGVHLPHSSLKDRARTLLGINAIIGTTIPLGEEHKKDQFDGFDYLEVGPFFPSYAKGEEKLISPSEVKTLVSEMKPFLLAFGGITSENKFSLFEQGIHSFVPLSPLDFFSKK